MNLKEAINVLETYNRWRRGAEIPQPKPSQIGESIDKVLNAVKKGIKAKK